MVLQAAALQRWSSSALNSPRGVAKLVTGPIFLTRRMQLLVGREFSATEVQRLSAHFHSVSLMINLRGASSRVASEATLPPLAPWAWAGLVVTPKLAMVPTTARLAAKRVREKGWIASVMSIPLWVRHAGIEIVWRGVDRFTLRITTYLDRF